MKLPRFTYVLRFVHRDNDDPDFHEHTSFEDARYHMHLFDDSDADLYDRIELYRRDYTGRTDTLLETKNFILRRKP